MYGYGVKLCNHPELVEDSIQELFQYIWERREELAHIDSPNIYLFVSLRRKILRKLKMSDKIDGTINENSWSPNIEFGPDEIIIKDESRKQNKEALRKALNSLPNRQKEIVYLHYFNGLSYGEIEELLSIKRQSVRKEMYRAMEKLRAVLDKEIMRLVISLVVAVLVAV